MWGGVEYGSIPTTACDVYRSSRPPEAKALKLDAFARSETIRLDDRDLPSIPKKLYENTVVRTASFKNNKITDVPESISAWSRLEKLSLAGNQLKALPGAIGQLMSLRDLDLSHNNLGSVPNSLGAVSSLRRVNLNGNPPSCTVGGETLATVWYKSEGGDAPVQLVAPGDLQKRSGAVLAALRMGLPAEERKMVEESILKDRQSAAAKKVRAALPTGDRKAVASALTASKKAGLVGEPLQSIEGMDTILEELEKATADKDRGALQSGLEQFEQASGVAPRSAKGEAVRSAVRAMQEIQEKAKAEEFKREQSQRYEQSKARVKASEAGVGAEASSRGGGGKTSVSGEPSHATLKSEATEARLSKLKHKVPYEEWVKEKEAADRRKADKHNEQVRQERRRGAEARASETRRTREMQIREQGWPSVSAIEAGGPVAKDMQRLIDSRRYQPGVGLPGTSTKA